MDKRNFKCLNKDCGVNFTSNTIGNCPVCGSDKVKLDKGRSLIAIVLILVVLISASTYFYIDYNNQNVELVVDQSLDSTVVTNLSERYESIHLQKIDFNNCSSNSFKIILENLNDSLLVISYSIDSGKTLNQTNSFAKNTEDSLIFVSIYKDGSIDSLIKYFDPVINPCKKNKMDISQREDAVDSFQQNFKKYVNNPETRGLQEVLNTEAAQIGFLNYLIEIKIGQQTKNYKIETLANFISEEFFDGIKYSIVGSFNIELNNEGEFLKASVELSEK